MRKTAVSISVAAVMLCLMVASVSASVSIQASINRDFHVVFTFTDIDTATYQNIRTNALINQDTVPLALYDYMVLRRGFLGVEYYAPSIAFDDAARSVISTFNFRGPSIINSTIDRSAQIETFTMKTEWRMFELNVTSGFVYNFTQSLSLPIVDWTNSTINGITSYSYSSPEGVTCTFTLPSYAANAIRIGDTIIFDGPYEPPFEDKILNSPLIMLMALAVVGVIFYVYRKIR